MAILMIASRIGYEFSSKGCFPDAPNLKLKDNRVVNIRKKLYFRWMLII